MACALAICAVTAVALAQGPPPGGGFGGGGFGPPGGFFGGGRGGPGGPGGFGGGEVSHLLTLTQDSAVWDEIKISDTQLGQVTRLVSTLSKKRRAFRDQIRAQQKQERDQQQAMAVAGQPVDQAARDAARQAQRQAEQAATTENNAVLQQEVEAALKKVLNKPGQFARVQQIDLQEAGPLVIARPDVTKALNLTPDQINKVQAVIAQLESGQNQLDESRRQFFDSMRQSGVFGGGPGGGPGGGRRGGGFNNNNNNNPNNPPQPQLSDAEREARRVQFQQTMVQMQTQSTGLKDQAVAAIGAILTKTQRANWSKLIGKPFDISMLNDERGPDNPFNPGGRFRGGPGGRGPGGGPGGGGTAGTAAGAGTAAPGGTATGTTTGTAATTTTKTAAPTKYATKGLTTKTATKSATGR
jgi:hypothetical protein